MDKGYRTQSILIGCAIIAFAGWRIVIETNPAELLSHPALAAEASTDKHASNGSTENYCNDPGTNSDWAQLLSKYPNDDAVAKLFALRIGLCELVTRKAITLDRATNLFEKERRLAVMEKKMRKPGKSFSF